MFIKKATQQFNLLSEMLDTPLTKWVWRVFMASVCAIGVYVWPLVKHDLITSDPSVVAIQVDTTAIKTKLIDHDTFIQQQTLVNSRLADFFKDSRVSRDDVAQKLSAIIQHNTDDDARLTRIETKLDR